MSEKPTLRIRFNLNQRTGASENVRNFQRAGSNFATVIVREVGYKAAEDRYRRLTKETRNELVKDVEQEIENIARRYTEIVIGRSGVRNTEHVLRGQTTPVHDFISFGKWKALSDNTIKRKGHRDFFKDRQGLASQVNRGSFWTRNFGPIQVRIDRIKSNTPPIENPYKVAQAGAGARVAHFSVARISVFALGKITPAMVPELATSSLAHGNYRGRDQGLLKLIGNQDTRLKLGNWGRDGKGAYRPSLEPFLGFVLTRAIPAAVKRRITKRNGEYPGGERRIR